MILGHKGAVTPGNCFSFNLSRNFVAPLRDKLRATLPSVTPLRNAKNSLQRCEDLCGTDFYFSQRTIAASKKLRAIFPATCIATKLRDKSDKLQERLPSVTAP